VLTAGSDSRQGASRVRTKRNAKCNKRHGTSSMQVVGEGFHPKAGQPHAEVFALRAAGARSNSDYIVTHSVFYAVLWPALYCDSPGLQLCITPELSPPVSWSLLRVSTQGSGWRGRRHAYTRSLAVTLKSIGHNFPWISLQGSGRRAQRFT